MSHVAALAKPYSAIVFKFTYGGTTYNVAMGVGDGYFKLINYDTDATTVIQGAINFLITGFIYIKDGTYNINIALVLKEGIYFFGESMSGTIINQTNAANDVLAAVYGVGTEQRWIGLYNLKLTGGAYAIHFEYVYNSTIDRVYIDGTAEHSVYLVDSHGLNLGYVHVVNSAKRAFFVIRCNAFKASYLGAFTSTQNAIQIQDSNGVNVFVDIESTSAAGYGLAILGVVGGRFSGYIERGDGDASISLTAGAVNLTNDQVVIDDFWIDSNSHSYGILAAHCNYLKIGNSTHISGTTSFDIYIYADSSYTLLERGPWTVSDNSATTMEIGCTTFLQHNRVPAIIGAAATSIVVAHGCSYTPAAGDIHPTLTNLPTTPIGDIYIDTIGAANFTLHCTTPPGVATAIFDVSIQRTP